MRSGSGLILLFIASLLCLQLLVAPASAATCLASIPPLKLGAACGFSARCQNDLFCNEKGICSAKKEDGQPCLNSGQCKWQSDCRGELGKQVCTARVMPGQPCNLTSELVGPLCGAMPAFPFQTDSCDEIQHICKGGMVGDACTGTANETCSGKLSCSNGVCTPLEDGATCETSNDCKPQSHCSPHDSKCNPRKSEGSCRLGQTDCLFGYSCLGFSSADYRMCVPWESREKGEYCESDNDCKGPSRCMGNLCASKKQATCVVSEDCGADKYCSCGGKGLLDIGVGTCRSFSCVSKSLKLSECADANCRSSNTAFSQSCLLLHCADQLASYSACFDS